jgi:hypothetical protein
MADNFSIQYEKPKLLIGATGPVIFNSDLVPGTNDLYNIGLSESQWKNIYVKDSIYINNVPITSLDGHIHLPLSITGFHQGFGLIGPTGPQGVIGPTGPQGVIGPTGPILTESDKNIHITHQGNINEEVVSLKTEGGAIINKDLNVKGEISSTKMTSQLFEAKLNTISSDERIKTNIEKIKIDDAFEMIKKLQPCVYNFIDSKISQKKQYGFIAQDVKQIIPDAVEVNNQSNIDDFHSLNNNSLLTIAIASIQKLIQLIENNQSSL